jgi:glycogen debranching enzyme
MLIREVKKQLIGEIESLKDERGLIQAGYPYYDRFFGRDSLIVSWQLLDINPDICKETLEALSRLRGKKINKEREEEPGKILHETDFKRKRHPQGWFPFPYYGSVDSTPLYLILFYFYFKKTKDKKFLKKYWKNILSAINWLGKYGDLDKDLFLEYQSKNPRGLFHQGWKDLPEKDLKIKAPVAIVEAQGYQYSALKGTAFLAKILKEKDLAKKLSKRANDLKKSFNRAFWLEKEKYFALALDGKKEQYKAITSNPGHLLFTGILEKDKISPLVKRLFKSDLWTPFGIRTHSSKEPDFDPESYQKGSVWPHDNWIIAQGLRKLGYKKEYQKIKKALFAAFQKLGYLPELYGVIDNKIIKIPQACYPQAWSSGALLNFLAT